MTGGDLPSILLQICRTAILVLVFGGLLYAAVTWLAGVPGAQWWIAVILSGPLALLLAWHVARALRDGVIPSNWTTVSRAEQPGLFWLLVAWEAVATAALAAIALWAARSLDAPL